MSIVQDFYDNLASEYDKLFLDWEKESSEQAAFLDGIFIENGFKKDAAILDCASGIGTQAIGLAALGYEVTASDISEKELSEAKKRAEKRNVRIDFKRADFCNLSSVFKNQFDIIIAMDNALPHMLSEEKLKKAVKSISNQLKKGGIFVASIRDYDAILKKKPPYSPPYIHKTENGRRVSFQVWDWKGDNYGLTQYIIEDEGELKINKFECEYRATKREELSRYLLEYCKEVQWKMPEETGFYQPVLVAKK